MRSRRCAMPFSSLQTLRLFRSCWLTQLSRQMTRNRLMRRFRFYTRPSARNRKRPTPTQPWPWLTRARTISLTPTSPQRKPPSHVATTRLRANSPSAPRCAFRSGHPAGFAPTTSLLSTRTTSRIRFGRVNKEKDDYYGVEPTHDVCDLDDDVLGAPRYRAGS